MKKLAIMFVMLLGSVATMQAQTFDFGCYTAPLYGFTGEEVDRLIETEFQDGDGYFQIPSADGQDYVIIEFVSGQYSVYEESGDDYGTEDTFVGALALAYEFAGIPHGTIAVGGINFDTISYDEDNRLSGSIGTQFRIVLSNTLGVGDDVHPADVVYSIQQAFDWEVVNATIDGNILTGTFTEGPARFGVYASSVRTGQTIYGRVHINGTN